MSASLSGLSASVTRILFLTGFAKELKTKDIQAAFSDWENVGGGFKIKWRDDTSLLIVFQDATAAKRAYLSTVANPPEILAANGTPAVIKPYDGPDAQAVIQNVNSRGQHTSNASRRAQSISVIPGRTAAPRNGSGVPAVNTNGTIPEDGAPDGKREPSPTLPNLPAHPTLNSLINSSLGEAGEPPHADPAVLATSMEGVAAAAGGPRIGDPGKRMLGAALGVRHPGLPPRQVNGNGSGGQAQEPAMREVQRAMGGLTVAE